uniref:Lymphatic vessel endothelial hyaluronic receptor 1a n=1 Tax=Cyprinus carpio TaxID=7962 RepID=A0A8C1ZRJ1_CYPCA
MARVWMRMLKMMMLFSGLFVSLNPKQAISGLIISSIGNQYALNASAARDLCEHLGLTIASKAQVAEAQKHSLETCRFGWIDEQIAVVPRVQAKANCGSGKTGVVVWHANPSTKFEVFYISLGVFSLLEMCILKNVPIHVICALHITYPSAHTHTIVNTHTFCEYGSHIAAAPREQLGVRWLA